ncbi:MULTISPECIES: IclR family transcriptional regulator [unclassified Ruegeria]|uniref:IclR family transcriptional regulator n=1 Tax=unclassified Ruegeria TaxID=2625375 RepID=UPI001488E767|nr:MULTISPECIES: IclR family transcriptional regulator [unclassified Ruegeria]NOD64841.1 helix-turn-helix domain-containing protein [Ruegeria sp. HKCCD6109]
MVKQVQGTQSFARSIGLLQHICDRKNPPTLADLLEECAFTRPTLYRLLNSLEAEGLIVQLRDKRYKPGPRLVNLARLALASSDIRDRARDALVRVRDQTGETVHLAVPSGEGLVYIDKIESLETVRMNSTIGTFVPLHSSGVGKAYLSALSDEKLSALLEASSLQPITPFTTTDPIKLRAQIDQCRAQGFVFDSQENEVGIACFGAAILDENACPIAAVSISVPLFRLRDDKSHYTDALLDCVQELSLGEVHH